MAISRRALICASLVFVLPAPLRAQEKLAVVASFSILGDFVREVGGERIELTTLVGADGDAHVYSPTPADAKAMAGAKLVITNGLKFEGWMDRLIKSAATKAPVAEATKGIAILKVPGGHSHGHSHGAKDKHGHDHSGQADPHAWQSVRNAKVYVANIRDALVAADPAGKASYEANANAYLAKLDALDGEVKAAVARIPAASRKLITSHDAFGHFARDYGIAFLAPRGISTESEASAKDVARLIKQAKDQKVGAVFLENITNPRLIEQIAKESGARVGGRLYSDALSAPSGPAGTYIQMIQHNIRAIEKALVPGAA
ncbi:MAG: metal ABC transporter substrate-binding protein [Bosea sp. (in: a-proteobacteria)]